MIYYRALEDTSVLCLTNFTKTGKLISQVDVCANWGDYGRLGARLTATGNIITGKFIMGKELQDDLSKLDSRYVYRRYQIATSNGTIKELQRDSGKIILKIKDGDILADQ